MSHCSNNQFRITIIYIHVAHIEIYFDQSGVDCFFQNDNLIALQDLSCKVLSLTQTYCRISINVRQFKQIFCDPCITTETQGSRQCLIRRQLVGRSFLAPTARPVSRSSSARSGPRARRRLKETPCPFLLRRISLARQQSLISSSVACR